MNRNLFLSLLIVFFTISLVGCSDNKNSDDKKVNYQLQEQCGKSSEEYFRITYGELFGGGWNSEYKNHYNKNMNKCFILVDIVSPIKVNRKYLWDVNENKQYGMFNNSSKGIITWCRVSGKECKSISEWDSLVKSYMED
jgi:hypothetical protein